MRNKNILYTVLLLLVIGVIYTSCKNITPEQEHITKDIELKINK